MAPLQAGDAFPSDVSFQYIPWSDEKDDIKACGIPVKYDASKEWADKKVVIFALPGAFTPTCSASHLPGYIEKLPELKAKGVDKVVVLAYNDPYVMSAWGKANAVTGEDILFLSDYEAKFSKAHAWTWNDRTNRYGIIVDHGKVVYSECEPGPQELVVSSAEAMLKAL